MRKSATGTIPPLHDFHALSFTHIIHCIITSCCESFLFPAIFMSITNYHSLRDTKSTPNRSSTNMQNDMLGKGERISPPQQGFFPILVGHIPHACGEKSPQVWGKWGNACFPLLSFVIVQYILAQTARNSSLLKWYDACNKHLRFFTPHSSFTAITCFIICYRR